ncbi:MAG: transcriptional regulator [Cyanobacteria bacterium J06606_4]
MIRTFNADSYGELLLRYKPKPITTDAENDAAIALALQLEHCSPRTYEEDVLLELLTTLIEKFEDEHYPIPEASPDHMLRYILEVSNTCQADLASLLLITNDEVAELVSGQKSINKMQAKILAERFKVSSSLFL